MAGEAKQGDQARPKSKPRRRPGTGNVYKRADGRWEGRLRIDGRLYRIYAKTERSAEHEVAALRAKIAGGQVSSPGQETIAQYLDRWLAIVGPPLAPKTVTSYSQHIRSHIVPSIGRIRLDRLDPSDVQRMIGELSHKRLSPSTIQRVRGTLRAALGMAMRWGLVVRNVATLVTLPTVRRPEIQPLSPEEISGFLAAMEDHPLGPLYLTALATGLRQGELLGLGWADVDLDRGWLYVRQQLQRINREYVLSQPKSDRSRRRIAIGGVALELLERQRDQQRKWRVEAGPAWDDRGLVFTTPLGRPLNNSSVTHRLAKLLNTKQLRVVRFHDLRHSAASLLLAEGASLKEVMETLGHSQFGLVAQTYGHLYDPARREVAARMDRALSPDAHLTHNGHSDAQRPLTLVP